MQEAVIVFMCLATGWIVGRVQASLIHDRAIKSLVYTIRMLVRSNNIDRLETLCDRLEEE